MTKKQLAYESPFCIVCGKDLEHKPTGRPRRFCSARCKQRDYREIRRWASACIDAIMAGEPEPPMRWRWAVRYELRTGGPYRPGEFSNKAHRGGADPGADQESLVTKRTP